MKKLIILPVLLICIGTLGQSGSANYKTFDNGSFHIGGYSGNGATQNFVVGNHYGNPDMASTNYSGGSMMSSGFKFLCEDTCCVRQTIDLNLSWNIISSYIKPDNPAMEDVFSEISSDIIILKDYLGQAFIPSLNINGIGDWEVEQGYQVKTTNSTILIMGCVQVDPVNTPIVLLTGWSMMGYLRTTDMNAATALSSIASNILLMKNVNGDAFIPSFSINTLGDMLPGEGYKIKMSADDTLYYPVNSKMLTTGIHQDPRQPVHFILSKNTGHNATVIIPAKHVGEIMPGDEIAIFNQRHQIAGAAVFEGYNLAVTIWGDDPTTDEVDGLTPSDGFVYRVWQNNSGREITAEVTYSAGFNSYLDDGISILKSLELRPNLQVEDQINVFPNPVKSTLNIEYYPLENDNVSIAVFDVYGQEILTGDFPVIAGVKNVSSIELSEYSAGLYICVIKSTGLSKTVKLNKH